MTSYVGAAWVDKARRSHADVWRRSGDLTLRSPTSLRVWSFSSEFCFDRNQFVVLPSGAPTDDPRTHKLSTNDINFSQPKNVTRRAPSESCFDLAADGGAHTVSDDSFISTERFLRAHFCYVLAFCPHVNSVLKHKTPSKVKILDLKHEKLRISEMQ